jgi:LDH2 family malate/lactate/ureidoglycolate dehydrogenase
MNVSPRHLLAFCRACFEKLRVPPTNAQLVAENLVFANLRGVDSHGVIRLKIYLERLHVGGFKPTALPKVVRQGPSSALMDAQHGIGQVAAAAAMKLAVAKARKTGAGFVSIRNSNHFGAAAFYATRAIPHGMIGFAATNAGPTMAPTGGREGRLGNNAMALAVPAGKYPPLVLDMATGAVAWGKIFVAQQEKRKIPTSWALDRHGVPTDDPNAAAHQGLIQPFGGYKGYGLSLLIDILTGVLSGGGFSKHVKTLYQQIDAPADVAQTCGALRIASFLPLAKFRRRMEEIIQLMHSCPTAPGVDRILVPGEIEHEIEKRRRTEGIPISAELRAELQAIGAQLHIRPPC